MFRITCKKMKITCFIEKARKKIQNNFYYGEYPVKILNRTFKIETFVKSLKIFCKYTENFQLKERKDL